jgi:hypothetical protein
MDAFERIRQRHAEPSCSQQTPPQPHEFSYTEKNKTRFHERAKRLSLAALETSHISKRPRRDVVCWEITIPSETASDLIAQALERWGE